MLVKVSLALFSMTKCIFQFIRSSVPIYPISRSNLTDHSVGMLVNQLHGLLASKPANNKTTHPEYCPTKPPAIVWIFRYIL